MNINKLIEEYPWSVETIICKGTTHTASEWVELCIKHEIVTALAKHLGCSPDAIRYQNKKFTELKSDKSKLSIKFLRMLKAKKCPRCKDIKELDKFYEDSHQKDGLRTRCKKCTCAVSKDYSQSEKGKTYQKAYSASDRGKEVQKVWRESEAGKVSRKVYDRSYKGRATKKIGNARRRAKKLNATVGWSDFLAIADFYYGCPKGYHVDHILPLHGELVSGLHVLENLQYLSAFDNISKSNKFDIEKQQ